VSYARDHLIPLVDEGLGNSAYLADLSDGRALAVDASRDPRALREAAAKRGLRIAFAADTHLHADFLSGAVQLAADDGATVLAAAAGHREFPHTALAGGDEVDLGGLTLQALATPGHTGEHLSWLIPDGVPLGFVLADGQDPAEVAWQALKIGHEDLAGRLDGGMAAWQADGGPAEQTGLVTAGGIGSRPVLDVRQAAEYASGHLPGAVHIELGDLPPGSGTRLPGRW
jgi:rhodanese-related sulfurtransferase